LWHRRLISINDNSVNLLDARHNQPPDPKPANQNFPITKFSDLMQSTCRPETCGYFGSTAGNPAVIEYGFQLETTLFADITQILEAIEEQVIDTLLAKTFPDICSGNGGRRLSLLSLGFTVNEQASYLSTNTSGASSVSITGFQFSKSVADLLRKLAFFRRLLI
jgi:hypothetical protein